MALTTLAACAPKDKAADGKVHVVASFYPLAEIAQRVGEGFVTVKNLTPAGVEPHDIELTPKDLDAIADADIVVSIGEGFQPAVEKAARQRGPNGNVEVGLRAGSNGKDPHFWLDPQRMVKAVELVRDAFHNADAEHLTGYDTNAAAYITELQALDERFTTALAHCERREIVTAHAAFGYLAQRYNLTQHAISGFSPDAEPSPARLAELEQYVKDHNVTTVFYEELVPRAFADTLAKATGVATAVLNPLEGLTKSEQKRGDDYVSVMGRNREALVQALGCA